MNRRIPSAAILALVFAAAAGAAPVTQVRVVVEGPIAVDEASVFAFIGLRAGVEFDRAQVTRDLKALEKTGRFERLDVRAEPSEEGVAVVYVVRARPRIGRIEIEGADRLGARTARETLGLELGAPADEAKLAAAARRLRDEYEKNFMPDARVSWKIEPEGGEGRAVVRVRVEEGEPARVNEIRFEGNTALSDAELRARMRQGRYVKYNPWHWVTSAGRLNPDDLEADVHAVRRAYLDRGYLDARVEPAALERVGTRRLRATFRIVEGPLYRISAVTVRGASVFPAEELLRIAGLPPGAPASAGAIEAAARAISDHYGDRGYARAAARATLDADPAAGTVAVAIEVREGAPARVRDVLIRGNTLTQDKVIRRELAVLPGDPYSRARIRTSERRLMNLGYFSRVEALTEPTPKPDETDIAFEVEEQRMGQAMASVGFSSIDQISGALEISHGNFDFRSWPPVGGGQKIRARAIIGTRRNDLEFSFTEPWFLDRRLALSFDLFRSEKRYLSTEYNQRNTGGAVSLARPIGPHERLRLAYSLEEIAVYDVAASAGDIIRAEEGARMKSAVAATLSRDTRDRVFLPTRGHRADLTLSVAGGPLGGETDLYALELSAAQYVPLGLGTVLSLRGRAAVVDTHSGAERVPIFDRYFLGGATTIRGFAYRDVGPRDDRGDPIGGRSLAFASAEYTVPLGGAFRAAVFYDIGLVDPGAYSFSADPNSSYGIGLRIDVPMLPLRFDYSWPLQTDAFNDRSSGRFSFLIGYGF